MQGVRSVVDSNFVSIRLLWYAYSNLPILGTIMYKALGGIKEYEGYLKT